jgi:hypothetical protein
MPRLHIFRIGDHASSDGLEWVFTAADLKATAEAYNPATSEAPLVVGHPTGNAPAYGWVTRLVAEGPDLYAEFDQVDQALRDMVRAGHYKKISASFYTPTGPRNPAPGVFYLRHVGFLGATPPAVKGLKSPVDAFGFAEPKGSVVVVERPHRPGPDAATIAWMKSLAD